MESILVSNRMMKHLNAIIPKRLEDARFRSFKQYPRSLKGNVDDEI